MILVANLLVNERSDKFVDNERRREHFALIGRHLLDTIDENWNDMKVLPLVSPSRNSRA